MGMGGGGSSSTQQQANWSDPQLRMQNIQANQMQDVWNQTGGADRFGRASNLYSPSDDERYVMNQWGQQLQGAQNWSPYNQSNNPYGGAQGGSSGEFTGITDGRSLSGGGQGQPTYGGNNANLPEGMAGISGGESGGGSQQSNNPAEEWYKRMQGAIGAGSQMPNLQGPNIQGMGPLQGPDIQGPDIREMGPLTQAPTAEAAIAAAQKNLSTITAPGLAQQAAATGGSMDSGAYLEALANAGTAASVPISQQQLAMQGQLGCRVTT